MEVYFTTAAGRSADPLAEAGDSESPLWTMNPDHIVLSNVQFFREISKRAYRDPISYSADEQKKDIHHSIQIYEQSISLIRKNSNRPVFLFTHFVAPRSGLGVHGYLSYKESLSHSELIKQYELELYALARRTERVFILDINQILAAKGFNHGIDPQSASGYYDHFTREGAVEIAKNLLYQMTVLSTELPRIKCCVFDLDNTLWHGIIREDGPSGVAPRWNVIDTLHDFSNRGILLAICSKNDPQEADHLPALLDKSVFEKFVAVKLNWLPKSHNIQEIAKELNIGIDTIAFFDDNERERAEVAQNCPSVKIFTEHDIVRALSLPEFENAGGATEEALTRTQKYHEQNKRKEVETTFDSENYDSFLTSCQFKLRLERPGPGEFSRIEELILRSNQLNATMKRTDKAQLLEMYKDAEHYEFFIADLSDRFGSYGLIGVVVAEKKTNNVWSIVELAFSCRAMGRKVEHALINHLTHVAQREGAKELQLNFIHTPKNKEILKILKELNFKADDDLYQQEEVRLTHHLNEFHYELSPWFEKVQQNN